MSKIGILHLTDLHITADDVFVNSLPQKICAAVRNDWFECEGLVILITGDIAFNGTLEEYTLGESFLINLKQLVQIDNYSLPIEFVIVPGNHDCDFSIENQARKNTLSKIDYKSIGNDNSVIDSGLSIQKSFWEFYSKFMNEIPSNRLNWKREISFSSIQLSFSCINTAWMTSEDKSTIFIPVKLFDNKIGSGLEIAVYHHPIEWMTPNSDVNNRNEFQKYLENNFAVSICGHEHDVKIKSTRDILDSKEILAIAGPALYSKWAGSFDSSLLSIVYDNSTSEFRVKNYKYNSDLYIEKNCVNHKVKNKGTSASFKFNDSFIEKINRIDIPILNRAGEQAKLKEIFVYPDLDAISKHEKDIIQYDDSARILDIKSDIIIIEGESQSGKTSLSLMLSLDFEKNNKYPLIIQRYDKNIELKKCLEFFYNSQYDAGFKSFEHYRQFDKTNKVLIIDYIETGRLKNDEFCSLLKESLTYFSKIIVFTNNSIGWQTKVNAMKESSSFFKIMPLGHLKRNEITNKYLKFYSCYSADESEQLYIEELRNSCNAIKHVVRNQIIPSYPIYVLSILQTFKKNNPINENQTSYGYCYQTLIHIALSEKAKVPDNKIDTYFQLLAEIAFWMYKTNTKMFSLEEYSRFHAQYSSRFVSPDVDTTIRSITASNIIYIEDGYYYFSYPYIYYFLIARKISDIITMPEAKQIIQKLCENLNSAESANVIIFISHHTRDVLLLDEAVFASMLPFDGVQPSTLDLKDDYYKIIGKTISTISNNILNDDICPIEEHKRQMKSLDSSESNKKDLDGKSVDSNDVLAPVLQSIRSIEIIGQIVKNRHGSIEIPKLREMIEAVYLVGFRTLEYFAIELIKAKNEFIEVVNSDSEKKRNLKYRGIIDIEKSVSKLIQSLSYMLCNAIIFRTSNAVSHRELRSLFIEVANKINSPIATLTSYSAIVSSSTIDIRELARLVDEFKSNPIAKSLLNEIVKKYVYSNNVEYSTKNKIASITGLQLQPRIKKRSNKR